MYESVGLEEGVWQANCAHSIAAMRDFRLAGVVMKFYFKAVLIFFFLAMFGIAWASNPDSAMKKNNLPASMQRVAQQLIDELTSQGLDVNYGYARLYTADDCEDSYPVMHTCYGNNPAAPYILFDTQYWPDEYIDSATVNAFGQTPPGYSTTFRFDPREAIVILGQLPPPAAYFGIQTYLYTREGDFSTESETYQFILQTFPALMDTFFTKVPQNQSRMQIAASLGNSNNNVVISNQTGSAFQQQRFFIITPDQYMDRIIRESLDVISVKETAVFTEPIPSTAITGLDESADDFVIVMRYAMPFDGGDPRSASNQWRTELPLLILRVRDSNQQRIVESYGTPVLEERTAISENFLASDLNNLVAEVSQRWGQPCITDDCSDKTEKFNDLQESKLHMVGPLCTEIGMNCLADTQDTTYQGTRNLSLDHGEVYAVAGTLGTRTGNATYVGLSVNESKMVKGITNINSDELTNSANAYAMMLKNPTKFYLYYFTRDCSGLDALTDGNCFSITSEMIEVCNEYGSPDCDYLKLIQRAYLKKGSERGPDSSMTLPPRLIKLTRN
jgi:hypothetical protein